MSRMSGDELSDGKVFNGFDYDLQVWVVKGVIQRCGHKEDFDCQCNAKIHAGKLLKEVV